MATGGAFMHINAKYAKTILTNILNDLPEEKEELLEEEDLLAKNELLPDSSQTLANLEPELSDEKEITPLSDFMLEYEDNIFDDYGHTSLYHKIIKPQESRNFKCFNPHHPADLRFLRLVTRELIFVLGNEWLIESKL